MLNPYVLDETPSYIVVYKPPWMHSVPLNLGGDSQEQTLLDWCAALVPAVLAVSGRNPWEGGILHRLDYETQGLVLFAKTQAALDLLNAQQKQGRFIKEYSALSIPGPSLPLPGFPCAPAISGIPLIIESGFRPFGPGRRAVRPISPGHSREEGKRVRKCALDQGGLYKTEILDRYDSGEETCFQLRISRGFRHQIRCHLAWIGFPLLNDRLYGGISTAPAPPDKKGFAPLALRARGISFYDPASGTPRRYTVPGFSPNPNPQIKA